MRRLAALLRQERGASAVLVAVLMVPLIGMVALGVDVGSMYWENAQLQNGADAAALAVAKSCADQSQTSNCTGAAALATSIAGGNANDSAADAAVSWPGNCSSGAAAGNYVRVDTSTLTPGGSTVYQHPFATALGALLGTPNPATTIRASACAHWGYPTTSTPMLPLAISLCSFTPALSGNKVLIEYANPQQQASCPGNAAYPPGGFGWLQDVGCVATIDQGNTAPGAPGNSYPNACDSVMNTAMGKTILVPIFDQVTAGSGQNGQNQYHISGFAAFVITGWRLGGGNSLPQNYNDPSAPACTGSCRGIQGYFTHWTTTTSGSVGGTNYGAVIVALVG